MLPVAEIVRYWSSSSEQSAPTAWLVWWPSSSAVDDPPDTRDRIANPRSGPAPSSRTGSGGRVSWPGRSCPSSSARAVSLVTTVFPAKRQSLVERPWSASANALPADPSVALSPRPSPAAGPRVSKRCYRGRVGWRIRGTYFESCNCDAICPCRRIDGVASGRSTHGVCMGVLSWLIEDGAANGTELSGLPVALAIRYSDDEPGSPWTWVLYLDAAASDPQRKALQAIFRGRLGGDALSHFPWAWKDSELVAVRPVEIYVDHTRRRQRLRIRDHISVRIRDRYAGEETVTCVIPGHHRAGEELVADELVVKDGPLAFSYRGVCGYGTTFDYSG
ncbi:MAG: DUF1326 domain-containing protein [Solirubrobacteraceae bacterium]